MKDSNKRITISFGGIPMLATMILLVLKLLNVGNFGWFWVFFPLILPVGVFLGILLLWIVIVVISTLLERRW
jgi:hypothetical protein